MKIYLVGTHSTGKTTIAKALASYLGIPYHRLDTAQSIGNFKKNKYRLDKIPNQISFQEKYFANMKKEFSEAPDSYVTDGHPITCIAYIEALLKGDFSEKVDNLLKEVQTFLLKNIKEDDVIVYLPPNIPLEDDGFRPLSNALRLSIAEKIEALTITHYRAKQIIYVNEANHKYRMDQILKSLPSKTKPVVFAYEGLPGSGKSTHFAMVRDLFHGTSIGFVNRKTRTEAYRKKINSLYTSPKANFAKIKSSYVEAFSNLQVDNFSKALVMDRSPLTAWAVLKAIDPNYLYSEFLYDFRNCMMPKYYVFKRMEPNEAIGWVKARGSKDENILKTDIKFQTSVHENYLELGKKTGYFHLPMNDLVSRLMVKYISPHEIDQVIKNLNNMYCKYLHTRPYRQEDHILDLQVQLGTIAKRSLLDKGANYNTSTHLVDEQYADIMIHAISLLKDYSLDQMADRVNSSAKKILSRYLLENPK